MQQQQELQENKNQLRNPFPEETQQVLSKFISILKNKQRIPKFQFEQKKNDDEEFYFDTLLDQREIGSQFSQKSQDSQQTYISINFTDDDSKILEKILTNLLIENFQYSNDQKQKGQSDLQNQQFSYVIQQERQINSDVVQPIDQDDSSDETYVSAQKSNTKKKIVNSKQVFNSLRNLNFKYKKQLDEITNTKNNQNQMHVMKKVKENRSKFNSNLQTMKSEKLIFEQCQLIIDENLQTIQQYDKAFQDLYNP